MKLSRAQIIVVAIMGTMTIGVYVLLIGIVIRNMRLLSQGPAATISVLALPGQEGEGTGVPTEPYVTPGPPTATPVVPQTRYDLQVARDPQNALLRLDRGYAYMALGAYASAIEDFTIAIDLNASLAEAYVGRGEARFYTRGWNEALADFDQALRLNPSLPDAHAWRGHLLSERGDYGPGIEALQEAVILDDADPQKRIWLAQALLASGEPANAEQVFGEAIARDARSIEAYVGRAMALAEQGDLEGAWVDIYLAQGISPYDPRVLNGQAWLYGWYLNDSLGEAEALALRAISEATGDLQKARYLYTLGWIYYRQAMYAEAETALSESAELATVDGQVAYPDIVTLLDQVRDAQ